MLVQSLLLQTPPLGELTLGKAHLRIIAVADFKHQKVKPWGPDGKPLSPEAAKTWAKVAEAMEGRMFLRHPNDRPRAILLQTDCPEEWTVFPYTADGTETGSNGAGPYKKGHDLEFHYLSVPGNARTMSLPVLAYTKTFTTLYEFDDSPKTTIGDVTIEVEFRQEAQAAYTATSHESYPVTHYLVKADMPKEKFSPELTASPQAIPKLGAKSDLNDMLGLTPSKHGLVDMKDLGNGRIDAVFEVHVLGLRKAGTKLRIGQNEVLKGNLAFAVDP